MDDVTSVKNDLSLIFSTSTTDKWKKGLTIDDTVDISGAFLERLKVLRQTDLKCDLNLFIPVFDASLDLVAAFEIDNVVLTEKTTMKGKMKLMNFSLFEKSTNFYMVVTLSFYRSQIATGDQPFQT